MSYLRDIIEFFQLMPSWVYLFIGIWIICMIKAIHTWHKEYAKYKKHTAELNTLIQRNAELEYYMSLAISFRKTDTKKNG